MMSARALLPRGAHRATWHRIPSPSCPFARCLWATPRLEATDVKMPSLSPTMTEGTIVKWLKQEGEEVAAGDVLCEIQTDKAVVSLDHDDDGTLAKIVRQQDTGAIKVGELIAVMAEDGEDWKEVAKTAGQGGGGEAPAAPASSANEEPEEDEGPSGGSTPAVLMNMPALSPTMTEGTIVKWSKQEGEAFKAGDVICEIQTDKAVVSMEADDEGVLAKIMVPEGESGIKVGQLIALSVEEGEDWKDVQIPAKKKEKKAAPADAPAPAAAAPQAAEAGGRTGEHKFVHVPNAGPATNLLLTQYGIDPSDVKASGPKGIVKSDVLSHIKSNGLQPIKVSAEPDAPKAAATSAPRAASKPTSGYTDHPLSSMRAVIAKRLSQSKQTSPHGHCTATADISALQAIRADYADAGFKISLNDLVIKAVGAALQQCPELNLNVSGEDFEVMPNVDVSVAVATDSGLITPIVTDVPSRSLVEVAETVRDLAKRAREGKLQLNEFQGGTFTISNLGMFGIHEFTAIINPPQVGILAVGGGVQEVDPDTGRAVTRMRSTLSFDRRFVDEAAAADFMSTLRRVMERPEYMNLGFVPVARKRNLSLS